MVTWLDNAIFYEIYPQSFKDTNADGIGDFAGIEELISTLESLKNQGKGILVLSVDDVEIEKISDFCISI